MSDNKYTCAMCHNTYDKEISDEEAMQETQRYFPRTKREECGVVCDDCWQLIKPLKTSDQFEQHLNDWLRSVHLDTVAEQEQRNMDTLIKTLECQGHSVQISEDRHYIHVDELSIITMDSARWTAVDRLVGWVNDNNVRETMRRVEDTHGNQECDSQM